MSFDQIVAEASSLTPEQRKELVSRLLAIGREERDSEFRRMLARKIDDQDPSHWVPMEDLTRHLRLDSDTE